MKVLQILLKMLCLLLIPINIFANQTIIVPTQKNAELIFTGRNKYVTYMAFTQAIRKIEVVQSPVSLREVTQIPKHFVDTSKSDQRKQPLKNGVQVVLIVWPSKRQLTAQHTRFDVLLKNNVLRIIPSETIKPKYIYQLVTYNSGDTIIDINRKGKVFMQNKVELQPVYKEQQAKRK